MNNKVNPDEARRTIKKTIKMFYNLRLMIESYTIVLEILDRLLEKQEREKENEFN